MWWSWVVLDSRLKDYGNDGGGCADKTLSINPTIDFIAGFQTQALKPFRPNISPNQPACRWPEHRLPIRRMLAVYSELLRVSYNGYYLSFPCS